MPKKSKSYEAKNLQEQIDAWYQIVSALPGDNESEDQGTHRASAERITGAMGNDNFDEWYQDGEGDPRFVEVFDLASSLELPPDLNLNIESSKRDEAWRRLKALILALKDKYIDKGENPERFLEDTVSFREELGPYLEQ